MSVHHIVCRECDFEELTSEGEDAAETIADTHERSTDHHVVAEEVADE